MQYNMEQERERKQNLLMNEIIDGGYDTMAF